MEDGLIDLGLRKGENSSRGYFKRRRDLEAGPRKDGRGVQCVLGGRARNTFQRFKLFSDAEDRALF